MQPNSDQAHDEQTDETLLTLEGAMSEQLTATQFTPAPQLEPLQVEVTEAARLLGYSRSTIYEMLNSGELPSTLHGSSRRIPVAALRAWIEAHTQQSI
jgi:excisionase family DNA binding protein